MDPIRVFIADDHELVRYGLKSLLESEPGIEIVGEAGDTPSTIAGVCETDADILVLDVRMPGGGGIEACKKVLECRPQTKVLVLTSFDDDESIFGLLDAGASGYILKDTTPRHVIDAIHSVADGQSVFDASIAHRVIEGRIGHGEDPWHGKEPLSEREIDVLRLMARGISNRQIGAELWIGEATVKSHVSHILHKLGVNDRAGAVMEGVRLGVVHLESGA